MALFSSRENESSALENQHYIDFLNSQKLSLEELREVKKSLYEFNKNLQSIFLNATKENTDAFKALSNQLNPPGSEQRSYDSTTRTSDYSKLNDTLGSIKEFLSKLSLPSGPNGEPGGNVKSLVDEVKSIFLTGLLALVALPFMGPVVDWFDKNFGTNIRKTYDSLMQKLEWITNPILNAKNKLVEWIDTTILWFKTFINDPQQVFNDFKKQISNYFDQFLAFLGGGTDTNNVFQRIWTKISYYFDSFMSSMKQFIKDHEKAFNKIYENVKSHLINFFISQMGVSKETEAQLRLIFGDTKGIFESIMKLLKDVYDSGIIQAKFALVIEEMTQNIKKKTNELLDTILKSVTGFIVDIKDKLLLSMFEPEKVSKKGTDVKGTDGAEYWLQTEERKYGLMARQLGVPAAFERAEAKRLAEQVKQIEDQQKLKSKVDIYNEKVEGFNKTHPEITETWNKLLDKTKKIKEEIKTQSAESLKESATQKIEEAKMFAEEVGNAVATVLAPYLEQIKTPTIISAGGSKSSSSETMTPLPGVSPNATGTFRNSYYEGIRQRLGLVP
jgi:hypothetical protein